MENSYSNTRTDGKSENHPPAFSMGYPTTADSLAHSQPTQLYDPYVNHTLSSRELSNEERKEDDKNEEQESTNPFLIDLETELTEGQDLLHKEGYASGLMHSNNRIDREDNTHQMPSAAQETNGYSPAIPTGSSYLNNPNTSIIETEELPSYPSNTPIENNTSIFSNINLNESLNDNREPDLFKLERMKSSEYNPYQPPYDIPVKTISSFPRTGYGSVGTENSYHSTQSENLNKPTDEMPTAQEEGFSSKLLATLGISKIFNLFIEFFKSIFGGIIKLDFIANLAGHINGCFNCEETPLNGLIWCSAIMIGGLGYFLYLQYYYIILAILISVGVGRYLYMQTLKDSIIINMFLLVVCVYFLNTFFFLLTIFLGFFFIEWIRSQRTKISKLDILVGLAAVSSGILLFVFNQWWYRNPALSIRGMMVVKSMIFIFILFSIGIARSVSEWFNEAMNGLVASEKEKNNNSEQPTEATVFSTPEEKDTDYLTLKNIKKQIRDTIANSALSPLYNFSLFWVAIAFTCSILTGSYLYTLSGKAATSCIPPLQVKS